MNKAPQIVISGYYGFGNAGDEAVLAGMMDAFRAAIPGAALRVASVDPDATRRLHGVESFGRYRWRDFGARVRACDAFVSGGGSLFQDVTSRRSLYYYLGTLALAGIYRRPVMVCGQGIGPIRSATARRVTAALLNRARLITVRDPGSLETLQRLGVARPEIHLTADPVFALQPSPRAVAERILRREGVSLDVPRVAFALRPVPRGVEPGDAVVSALAEAAAFVHRELGAQPVFVPMHPPADRNFARRVAEAAGVPAAILSGGVPPRDAPALFGRMDLVVGVRLHALIFAAVQGVPLVGISYDPKVEGFLRSLGRTPASDLASIRGVVLVDAIRHVWEAREEEAAHLRRAAAPLREKALENGSLLATLIASRTGP
ncbi:MAG: polysaccharide pyruvyl transferase CsaB [Armatimonadetes bacterium]|nr:polysaccharide pyruvyl transferase CsaB [Armatimonadota bacterium]